MKWFCLYEKTVDLFCGHGHALEWACLRAAIKRAGGRRAVVVGKIGGRFVRVY